MDEVVLVDENDQELGTLEKLRAHQEGKLHRAFSIFIFNDQGELLLQRRAFGKYHSEGLWSNTCCSHPRPGEQLADAALRRLKEELGMACELIYGFSFQYKADFDNGLTEHELDHVFVGTSNDEPLLNLQEVSEFKYIRHEDLVSSIEELPQEYTTWFKLVFERVWNHYNLIK